MPTNPAKFNYRKKTLPVILFVVYPDVKLLDLAGPLQVFCDTLNDRGSPAYTTVVASMDGATIKSDTPVSLTTESLGKWVRRRVDTLIIVGGKGVHAAVQDIALLTLIKQFGARTRRVGSICNGAFVLAACGLLNGRRVTTHWESCDRLAADYPAVNVESNSIFVNDDNVWTSAGVTAGIDMAIAMVQEDFNRATALSVARSLVTYLVRPGGQSQFSEVLDLQAADGAGRFDDLHSWMQRHLKDDLRNDRLAQRARMSARNFARVYLTNTGRTPAKAVEAMRVEAARTMLEQGNASIGSIARRCGFENDERMRRSFVRMLDVSPLDYRSRFRNSRKG